MESKRQMGFVAAVLVLSMCVSAYSEWTEPIHLSELNTTDYIATRPRISSDENIIYFLRPVKPDPYYLWEAQRNEETGLYEQQRVVSEIGRLGGRLIFGVWMSEDSNRMYHCWADSNLNGGWGRALSMAVRNSPDELWHQTRHHSELQTDHSLSYVSLTSDELNVMWASGPEGAVMDKTFTASRSSIDSDFNNIHQATELDEIGAREPYMSADGLSVYFSIVNELGYSDIWKGTRVSLDEPFGEFEPLSDIINQPESKSLSPCITPSGNALYFFRGGGTVDASEAGIYVSYWVETPYETAVRSIRQAIAEKEAAIENINTALKVEIAAFRSLNKMLKSKEYDGLKKRDIIKSRQELLHGIRKQISARRALLDGLKDIENSLDILLGEETEDNGNHGRP